MRDMRLVAAVALVSTLGLACAPSHALGLVNTLTDVAPLQARAEQAQPKNKCFLYAELVSQMTELALHQFNSNDSVQASETLKLVQRYTEEVHLRITNDSKKLKTAELLMRRASFRLKNLLSEAPYEDQPALEAALKRLNQVQAQLMMQVFKQ